MHSTIEVGGPDGFSLQLGPDSVYITIEEQEKARDLEDRGLKQPKTISTVNTTCIYFAVNHEQHWAPVCLRLTPFTLSHVPGQTFYCAYFRYFEGCHPGIGKDSIIKEVQRVCSVYFAVGPCEFDEKNSQGIPPINVAEGTSCHTKAQLAFDELIQWSNPPARWIYDKVAAGPKARQLSTKNLAKRRRLTTSTPGPTGLPAPDPAPESRKLTQGSVLTLCASIAASQAQDKLGLGDSENSPGKKGTAKRLFQQLTEALQSVGNRDRIAELVNYDSEGVRYCLPSINGQVESDMAMWEEAKKIEKSRKDGICAVTWTLRFVSTCIRLCRRDLLGEKVEELEESEERKRVRWEKGVLMLNRMVDQLGPIGLRLYDAAADKTLLLASYTDKNKEDRDAIADNTTELLLKWNKKSEADQISPSNTLRVLYPPPFVQSMLPLPDKIKHADVCRVLGLDNFAVVQTESQFPTLQLLSPLWTGDGEIGTSPRQQTPLEGRGGDGNSPPATRPHRKRPRAQDDHGSPARGESDAEVQQTRFDGQSHHAGLLISGSHHQLFSPPASQPQSRPNNQVRTLDHSNANLGPLGTGDEAERANLETRTFTPINTSQHAGPVASRTANASAAPSSLQRTFMGLIPSFQPSVRVHPPSSGAPLSFNDKQHRPEPTGCRPGSDRSGEPAGANWHADQSPGVTPLCTPAQSQVIAGEVVGNRFQADSHPALVRTGDGGNSQAHTFNAEDVGERHVTNSAALGDIQPPSIPTKARSGYGQACKTQSNDDHSRKRQRRDESRGPPHLLPTPPASQSQTQPNRSTRTAHTVGDNGAGLHPDYPIYVSSPPALQTKGTIAGLVLPDLCGAVEEQLAALISFGSGHYPPDDFVQFRPREMITGRILYELLHLELKQFSNHALGVPSQRVTKTTADVIVWPENVNSNHWVIAMIDKRQKRFTSYGMTKEKMDECRGAYQKALGSMSLEAVSYPLQDYAGNTCAFRCCDALAAYLGTRSEKIQDPVSLRLFYLRRLLQSRLQPDTISVPTLQPASNEADENESPGAEWRPGGTRLDTPAKSHAVGSPEDNPSPRGLGDNPSVAVSLELRLAQGQEQNPLPGPNISLPDGRSLHVEHLTCAVNGDMEVGIEQQTPLGGKSVDHHALSETIFSRLGILSQAAGSPTTQFQTWPNNGVHTAENNGNLSFLGGGQDGGVNSQEIPQPRVVEQAALLPDNTERAAHSDCVNPGLESALDLFASICAGQEGEPTSQRNEAPTGPTQPPGTANDTRRHPEPTDHDGQLPGAVALAEEAATLRPPNIFLEAARGVDPAILSAPTGQESRFGELVVDFIPSVGGSEGLARELVDTTADTSDTSDNCQADEVLTIEFSDWVDWNGAGIEMEDVM